MKNDDIFLDSRSYKLFHNEMSTNKKLRDTIVSFEELLNIKKNIRSIYNTDDPKKIQKLIGTLINGVIVTEKNYTDVLLISNTYKILYEKCKNLLKTRDSR